jgi:exodeoxyribonuclease V beta subunit
VPPRKRFAKLHDLRLTRARDRLWLHWGPVDWQTEKKGPWRQRSCTAAPWPTVARSAIAGEMPGHFAVNLQTITTAEPARGIDNDRQQPRPYKHSPRAPEASAGNSAQPHRLSTLQRSLHSAWRVGSFSGLAAASMRRDGC